MAAQRRKKQFDEAFTDEIRETPEPPELLMQSIEKDSQRASSQSFRAEYLAVKHEVEGESLDMHSPADAGPSDGLALVSPSPVDPLAFETRTPSSPIDHLTSQPRTSSSLIDRLTSQPRTPSPPIDHPTSHPHTPSYHIDPLTSQPRIPSSPIALRTHSPQLGSHGLLNSNTNTPKLILESLARQQAELKTQQDEQKSSKGQFSSPNLNTIYPGLFPSGVQHFNHHAVDHDHMSMDGSEPQVDLHSHKCEEDDDFMIIEETQPSNLKVRHNHSVSDDEDCMIIDIKAAPPAAVAKWNEHRFTSVKVENPRIKQEPNKSPSTPTPRQSQFEQLLAKQQRLLAQHNAPKPAVGNVGWRDESDESGSEKNARHLSSPINPIYREIREDPAQVDAALAPSGEDNSWMEQEDDIDEEYERMVNTAAQLKAKKNLSHDERMQLFKLTKQIQVKNRLRAAADHQGDDKLFVAQTSDFRNDIIQRHRRNVPKSKSPDIDIDDDDDDGSHNEDDDAAFARMLKEEFGGGGLAGPSSSVPAADLGLTKDGKPRKRRARAMNAREVFQQLEERRAKERTKAIKKRKTKPTKGKAGRGKGNKKESKASKTSKAKEKKGRGKGKAGATNSESLLKNDSYARDGMDIVGQMILDDLMANDPISDRLQDPIFNIEPAPEISGRMSKETQFQRLFANVPDGSNASMKVARDDKKRLKEASQAFGYAKCKAIDGKWHIKGMRSPLYHHQLLGAQWMLQRELSSQPPNGGLLADSMGLGKTVQMLACMVGNPPTQEDIQRGTKATLIVVPAGVIDQWQDEIRHHTTDHTFTKVIRYRSSTKLPVEVLKDLDIVVVSYSEVMKQFPFPSKKDRTLIQEQGYDKWWATAKEAVGELHQVSWFRVVLDEAQAIKNNSARTSLACQNLKSVYRWCLTGTPLLNKLEELFPYLRFLKANYSMDWDTFRKYFCDPDAQDSYDRIATLLSYTMMRRTMKTTILNRPIITLPKPHPEIVYVQLAPEEQIIYRITENRFRTNLNTYFAKSEARHNYGVFMVQLLRLRQCTSHPFMLERTIKESWTMEDVTECEEKLGKLKSVVDRKPFYQQCRVWVEQSQAQRLNLRDLQEDDGFMLPFGKGDYGTEFNFTHTLANISEEDLLGRVVCFLCSDIAYDAVKTDCGHIFCQECLHAYVAQKATVGDDEYTACPTCDRVFHTALPLEKGERVLPEDDNRWSASGSFSGKSKNGKKNKLGGPGSKGRDALGFEPSSDSSWLPRSDYDPDYSLTPSSKTLALKSILLRGFADAPLDKVVIYAQFRTLSRIVGRICEKEGWQFLYLTGDLSLEHRTKAIRKFRDDPNIKILIAGLKCGGLGLNFPWANRCISLDLWWNHAVEQQAFGRIFRIGQEKETHMTRIVVRNSIDMRMLKMQLYKLQNLEKAMQDGDSDRQLPNLNLNQLANLFGFLKTDDDNNIISIEPDYVDDEVGEGSGFGSQGDHIDLMDEDA